MKLQKSVNFEKLKYFKIKSHLWVSWDIVPLLSYIGTLGPSDPIGQGPIAPGSVSHGPV